MDYGVYLRKIDEMGLRKFWKGDPTALDSTSEVGANLTNMETVIDAALSLKSRESGPINRNSPKTNTSEYDEGR